MSLFPFTPEGVEDKLDELYALSDTALAVEAEAIRVNFRKWIRDNFVLSANQANFLTNINDDAAQYYGQECSFCFLNRLDIILVYPDPPTTPGYAKWPVSSNDIEVETDGTGQLAVSGSLTFTMTYK